jgi:PAS domain S-box-containing protein
VALGVLVAALGVAWRSRLREARMRAHEVQLEKDAEAMQAQAEALRDETQAVQAKADASRHSAEQAHELAATVIETATIAILAIDQSGALRWLNDTARGLTGYTREELVKGGWLNTFFPGEAYAPAEEALSMLMRQEAASVETRLIARQGEELHISWQCRQVLDGEEWLTLLFGVNLTDRVVAERERHDLERKLLDMQKLESLGVLAGGIAHDFNNLLTAILGNAQLAKLQTARSSPVHQHLTEIERTSMQAADLCKQMLAYSGQGKIEVRALDLNRIIRDMSQLLRISVGKKAQLTFNLVHSLPCIRGDVSQIRQILMNLVINASEAIGDSEGSIWVSTGVVHGAKELFRCATVMGQLAQEDYVYVEIADTGCGMNETTKTRIFDPFFTTKFTGRGLGLAAVLGIVRSHGGTLELVSREGEGTTFTLLFPCSEPAMVAHVDEEAPAFAHWIGEGLILVVDDEEGVRTLTTRMLESFEFRVITACDGGDAVEKFAAHAEAITAIIMDVTMPVMSGLQAMEVIRAVNPEVPILFMSGYMQEGALRNLIGATDFLQKPFKLEELQEKLRVLLDTQVEN